MVTKKDMVRLAETLGIAQAHEDGLDMIGNGTAERMIEAVAFALRGMNPRFDEDRFMLAVDWQRRATRARIRNGEEKRRIVRED